MDKPKPAPRGKLVQKRGSTSSESHDQDDEVEPVEEEEDIPHKKDRDKERPRSSLQPPGQGRKTNKNTTRPSSSVSNRRDRLKSTQRERESTISVEDDDDLDASDFRRQIDRLERDLTRRDRELEDERIENERCMDRIKKLERDKVELKREVEGFRDEAEEYKRTLDDYKHSLSRSKRNQAALGGSDLDDEDLINQNHQSYHGGFDITLQQKNREIEQLIEDTEKLEEDKKELEEKLTTLKESLSDATRQIESMAQDHFNFKARMQKADERIKQLEEEKTVLSIRERDLLGFKERHEQYLENLCNAVDIRVDVWKKMMFDKDEEIDRLNSKISALMSQIPNTQMDSERSTIQQLNRKLMERENQISLLNEKLYQAAEEIDSNVKLIESLHSKLTFTEDSEKTEQLVKSLQAKLKKVEDKLDRKSKQLQSVEKEAEEKSKEVTSLMSRLHAYEKGEYGLPEAVSEIKDLKIQIRVRDKQVEGVTQEINVLQMQVSDFQEENEMLREKLGLEKQADLSRDTKRYTKSRKNELTALRSKVGQLEEEVVLFKTRNCSLKKQLNHYDLNQQQDFQPGQQHHQFATGSGGPFIPPERERDRPDGGSVPSPKPSSDSTNQGDVFLKGITGQGFRPDEWKEKYEIILEENTALRRGLHEVLDCMHKMTDDGTTEVMIQAPVLEELLREMSARGIISYPYPISSFHMKVCNLEGKCSQLREELHRLRQDERQCRNELFEAQATIKILQEQLSSYSEQHMIEGYQEIQQTQHLSRHQRPLSKSPRPRSAASRSPSSRKKVTFEGGERDHDLIEEEEEALNAMQHFEPGRRSSEIIRSPTPPGRNLVLEDLQQEIEYLRSQNNLLKEKFAHEKSVIEDQLQNILQKASEVFSEQDGDARVQRKIEFLQAIKENQTNEINSLIRKLSEIENENTARIGFLERFKFKALHQISVFQQVLETSVPIHLLYSAKKQLRQVSDKLEELQKKEETFAIKTIAYHKNSQETAELRSDRDKLEVELSACQARLLELATRLESQEEKSGEKSSAQEEPTKLGSSPKRNLTSPLGITLESQNNDMAQKLHHTIKMNNLIKSQLEEVEASKRNLEAQLIDLAEKYSNSLKVEREAQEKTLNSVSREEYDGLLNKLIVVEEHLILAKDDVQKWKEMAEMTQNQIKAIENIKDFENMERDHLNKSLIELQSISDEKCLLAKAENKLLSADKEKHLAIQQVQKLLSKLSQLEAHSLHQDKLHQEREMALISMHTQVIMRYRSLFAALHESNSPKYNLRPPSAVALPSQDLREAFEMFEKGQKKCSNLEDQVLEERLKVEELEEKCKTLDAALRSLREGTGQEIVFESIQKIQESRVEVSRWKRKAEQIERDCVNLKESVHRLESRASDLEEDRIRLEHNLELKDSLTSTLMAKSMEQIPIIPLERVETLSSTSIPLFSASSTRFETLLPRPTTANKDSQTEGLVEAMNGDKDILLQRVSKDKEMLSEMMERLKSRVTELEATLSAKDDVINEIKIVRTQQERDVQRGPVETDLQDALIVARETINSLQDRMKSKEDNVSQYRRLLADVRTEMTQATERHVQEMRALQMTIHQQQQAFTRMKSTLSQPVKDSLNVEGTIKDQLTRIHELEDEVSELQHAMSNTATQLTAARSEAHRWRCNSEARMKELDAARDQGNMESQEEINSLRQEVRDTQRRLEEAQQQLASLKSGSHSKDSGMTDLVNVLRNELDEKDKQIEAYAKSLHNLRNSAKTSEKGVMEEDLHAKEKEVDSLKEEVVQLKKTISGLNVKVSKSKAINYKSGASAELEELRLKHRDLIDEKVKLENDLREFQKKRDEEELKKIKSAETIARWEESKKWKKNSEKLESQVKELESENERLKRTMQNLRITITRMEKEKATLETKLNPRITTRPNSVSTTTDRFSSDASMQSQVSHEQSLILAQGEIARLNMEIQDFKELVEKTEFEGREEAERLKMEVKLLKERIITQERQLTAYQIAKKGDASAITEIENMATRESQLQKEIRRLEEDNLHLNLQIEQLRMDTPRLRDRVQHLQRLVDALKAEKPLAASQNSNSVKSNSQKSLGELEKTINALKLVIDKLQNENKRLKTRPASGAQHSTSSERLKTSMDNLLDEKRLLMDKVQSFEHENEKLTKRYLEASSAIEKIESRLVDSEKRAKSAEMKLRTFLGEHGHTETASGSSTEQHQLGGSSYEALVQKLRNMQEELDHKSKLLATAKQSLRAAEKATAPKPSSSSTSFKSKEPQKNDDNSNHEH